MLTLNDGRNELWQWDTGRKLTVDADCSQVHFSNKVFGRSIDMDVVDGVAIIPDILLQTDKDLNAWAFVGTPENGYTKISKVFKVNKRNKPADYVFTPPEQTSLEEIKEKIEYLESIQDPDAIKNAVEDYLDRNPVEAPVQSVNGKTGKIKLTAEDVGAISQDDLQEATNEALAQAKESGEFDGKDGANGKDGKTPVKGIDYFDGQPGKDGEHGKDYVLTSADKEEIAELASELVEVPEGGGIAVTGAKVGQTVQIAEVDENGVPTAWEPTDFPSGGETEVKEWEEFLHLTTDNAETTVFDFSSNGKETLESKKVKEFYLYSPIRSQTSVDNGSAVATLSVNNCVTVTNLQDFCRANGGSLKLSLAAAADLLKFRYFGRDSEAHFYSSSPGYKDTSNGEIRADNKNYAAYIIGEKNGIPFPSAPVDYIETVTITLSAPCNSGVEFIVYVR